MPKDGAREEEPLGPAGQGLAALLLQGQSKVHGSPRHSETRISDAPGDRRVSIIAASHPSHDSRPSSPGGGTPKGKQLQFLYCMPLTPLCWHIRVVTPPSTLQACWHGGGRPSLTMSFDSSSAFLVRGGLHACNCLHHLLCLQSNDHTSHAVWCLAGILYFHALWPTAWRCQAIILWHPLNDKG